jgi:hypothetical protein
MSNVSEQNDAFEYTALAAVDPNFTPVPQAVYTLEIVSAGPKAFTYSSDSKPEAKNSHQKGDTGKLYNMKLVITEDDTYSGKNVFASFFPSEFTMKQFRRVMDATGIAQKDGQSISEWLTAFTTLSPRARFRTLVEIKEDGYKGNPENIVNFKEVLPA